MQITTILLTAEVLVNMVIFILIPFIGKRKYSLVFKKKTFSIISRVAAIVTALNVCFVIYFSRFFIAGFFTANSDYLMKHNGVNRLITIALLIFVMFDVTIVLSLKNSKYITEPEPTPLKYPFVYNSMSMKKQKDGMDKEMVKKMVCEAIDNIPECAEIQDCYTEHSYYDSEAYIKIRVAVKEETDENIEQFHDVAHDAFSTDMGFIS